MLVALLFAALALVAKASQVNFGFEAIQLDEGDIASFSDVAFGDALSISDSRGHHLDCKAFPGGSQWPSDYEWSRLNASLEGALLKPIPAASACYPGPFQNATTCNFLLTQARGTRFWLDDPLTVLTQWPQGETCLLQRAPAGNCTQGGFPVYVVNATTVKHVQMAVNFARNNFIRLVIKNTGHDFVGKSIGAGSLSVFTHHLKDFEFLPQLIVGEYRGPAARVGAGLEAWELYDYMALHNISIVVPAGYTVGPFGGWMLGGGHSNLASYHGMGSDQILSLQVITADGRLVTADPDTNRDLFYALRGGGPSTYGIVTSAIVKAHPALKVTASAISFSSGAVGVEAFWEGVDIIYSFGKRVCDAGGTSYNDVSPAQGANGFTIRSEFEFPALAPTEVFSFIQLLVDNLGAVGVMVTNPQPFPSRKWAPGSRGIGDVPGNTRFSSRLFPSRNWDNETLWAETMSAIRAVVEDGGYPFHGISMSPKDEIAGYPGENIDADIFDTYRPGQTPEQTLAAFARLNSYMDIIRAATPGGGAYVNEADRLEPNWQQSFFGDKYERLLAIKRRRDPWGLFWAPTTVGSEAWEIRTVNGLPTQNGPLCRV